MRGDLYRLRLPSGRGRVRSGRRYGVVVQSDRVTLSTVLVAPTSTRAAARSFRPQIDLDGTQTRVLVDQTQAVDAQMLGDFAGRLDPAELVEVEHALRLVFGLF